MSKEVKFWFTTKTGKHIPVFEGETKQEALNRSIDKNKKSESDNDKKQRRVQEEAEAQRSWEKETDKKLSKMDTDERIEDLEGELKYLDTKKELTKVDKEMQAKYKEELADLKRLKDERLKEKQIAVAHSSSGSQKSTQSQHKQVIKELSDSKYTDGTYDIATKKTKDFSNGYQVTFCQIGDNYTDADYQTKVNECLKLSSDGKTYAGKFEGTPEISFHCADKQKAIAYAKANNQISIWDWKQNQLALEYEKLYGEDDPRTIAAWVRCEIKTGGTGRRK